MLQAAAAMLAAAWASSFHQSCALSQEEPWLDAKKMKQPKLARVGSSVRRAEAERAQTERVERAERRKYQLGLDGAAQRGLEGREQAHRHR